MNIRLLAAIGATAMIIPTAPAIAGGWTTTTGGTTGHTHYCACGHAGWTTGSCGTTTTSGGSTGGTTTGGTTTGGTTTGGTTTGGTTTGGTTTGGTTTGGTTTGGTTTGGTTTGGTTTGGTTSGGSTSVPEPADFALFAAGVAGLLIGRRSAARRGRAAA